MIEIEKARKKSTLNQAFQHLEIIKQRGSTVQIGQFNAAVESASLRSNLQDDKDDMLKMIKIAESTSFAIVSYSKKTTVEKTKAQLKRFIDIQGESLKKVRKQKIKQAEEGISEEEEG